MDIYPDIPTQKDVSKQADMFVVISLPKQLSPVQTPEVMVMKI